MNPTTILMFNILDIFAELIFIVFQLGVLTRKYLLPVGVLVFVAIEAGWEYLTSQEFTVTVCDTPLALVRA